MQTILIPLFVILSYYVLGIITHNMAMIQPSFTSSKWNMGEIFGLKFPKKNIEIPPCGKRVIFLY